MKPIFTLPYREWRRLRRRAYAAQQRGQFEVAGLFAREARNKIHLFFMENESNEPCHFEFGWPAVRRTKRLIRAEKLRYMGIFHSHPVSYAKLGPADIRRARANSYHLVYDVCGTEARLWKLRKQKNRKVPLEIPLHIQRKTSPVATTG